MAHPPRPADSLQNSRASPSNRQVFSAQAPGVHWAVPPLCLAISLHLAWVIPGIWSSGLSSYSMVQQPFALAAAGFAAGLRPDGFFGMDPPSHQKSRLLIPHGSAVDHKQVNSILAKIARPPGREILIFWHEDDTYQRTCCAAAGTSGNGMVRPCSCPASDRSWQGAPKTRSTPCLRTQTPRSR
jgi:hypothetical protein